MNSSGLARFVRIAQWPLAVLLPLWVVGGRGIVVETGWMAVVGLVYYFLPAVLLMLVAPIITRFDPQARAAKAVRPGYSAVTVVLWTALLLCGLTIPDAASEPLPSAITVWTGGAVSNATSEGIFMVLFFLAVAALIAQIVFAIAGVVQGRRAQATPTPAPAVV